jgi:hypothetical protein
LKGSSIGQALLNLVPAKPLARPAAGSARKIAQAKFRSASSGFGAFAAAIAEIAALQRGWREFRMAQSSFEHGDPALPKNWTLSDCRDCLSKNSGGL